MMVNIVRFVKSFSNDLPIKIKVIFDGRNKGVRLILHYLFGGVVGVITNDTICFQVPDIVVIQKEDCPSLLIEVLYTCVLPVYHFMIKTGGVIFDVRILFKMTDKYSNTYSITIITDINVVTLNDLERNMVELVEKYIEKYGHYDVRLISEVKLKCRVIWQR
jgi:hypothetical protein